MAVFVTEFLHFYAMRNALYSLCLRGGTWSITCCILFVCGRNVINHAPTADALPVTNTKITPLIVIHESPCASVGAWFITFLTSPSRYSWFPQPLYTQTIKTNTAMEGDKSRMVSSLFAGRNVINYLLYTLCLRGGTWSITCCMLFVCGAERDQSRPYGWRPAVCKYEK